MSDHSRVFKVRPGGKDDGGEIEIYCRGDEVGLSVDDTLDSVYTYFSPEKAREMGEYLIRMSKLIEEGVHKWT